MKQINNKIFFYGPYFNPGGPCEVNRNIVKCLNGEMKIIRCKNKYLSKLEKIHKILTSKTIVFSGLMFSLYELKLARNLRRNIIYIMHGCSLVENEKHFVKEDSILEIADLILCVSESFCKQASSIFPQYRSKMDVLTNGIDWQALDRISKIIDGENRDQNRIILFGGGRQAKNNLSVCKAVKELNEEFNLNLHIDVYGRYNEMDDSREIKAFKEVSFLPLIPHEQVNKELARCKIFIQSSVFEPFSLALVDAIALGCDVLFSKYVGAKDIIAGKTDDDIIYDPYNIDEIKLKIYNLIHEPNNHRLLSSIDRQQTGIETATKLLLACCDR